MQSQKRQDDLCSFPRQTIHYHSNLNLYKIKKLRDGNKIARKNKELELNIKSAKLDKEGHDVKENICEEDIVVKNFIPETTQMT